MFTQLAPGVIDPFGIAPVLREFTGLVSIAALTQSEQNLHIFVGRDIEMNLKCCSRVAMGPRSITQTKTTQASRVRHLAFATDEFGAIGGDPMRDSI